MIAPLTSRQTECPRCHRSFTCRADDIAHCECSTVTLTDAERRYIAETHNDCLCADCLKEMKASLADKTYPPH
ncbi:MAG: cysteine-rich CWC family protein [Bacteroidetes bacterium]|nr:cysteine-rich CWC family protein [Bacteroidota bacterium]